MICSCLWEILKIVWIVDLLVLGNLIAQMSATFVEGKEKGGGVNPQIKENALAFIISCT